MSKNLSKLLRQIADLLESNPGFIKELETFVSNSTKSKKQEKHDGPSIDIWEAYAQQGSEYLKEQLNALSIKQLVKIIQENGLDQSKLSYKWKSEERLINLILERVADRANKGKIFMDYGKPTDADKGLPGANASDVNSSLPQEGENNARE